MLHLALTWVLIKDSTDAVVKHWNMYISPPFLKSYLTNWYQVLGKR